MYLNLWVGAATEERELVRRGEKLIAFNESVDDGSFRVFDTTTVADVPQTHLTVVRTTDNHQNKMQYTIIHLDANKGYSETPDPY